ncbi:unnamed protein product [Oppiella nova]|uniref:CBM21 domain-containing protein n=1 Tax=Oppiella nova TaxID=334625 RepID=A0A7R9M8H8_9ACAR|nr:unnamed protein product [Oppiella nova]CAG2172769.1 unnamed protein product [Oppiella nova]
MTLCPKPHEGYGFQTPRAPRVNTRAHNYQLFICGAEHESAAAWLAAATNACANTGPGGKKLEERQPQTVQPLGYKNDRRIRRTSILRQCPPNMYAELDPSAPTSPTEKKNVRFADSMGGQLESIKYFAISPQPVRRRHSTIAAPTFLYNQLYNKAPVVEDYANGRKCSLIPANFGNPSLRADFNARVERLSVSLHSVSTADTTIYGIIAVRNHSFIKRVYVRYTRNDWRTYVEVVANYMLGSHEGHADKFSFAIYSKPQEFVAALRAPATPTAPVPPFHPRLYFAVRYQTGDGREFWDNNDGANYCLNFLVTDYVCNLNTRPGA